jgi:hypothetical protein
MSDSNRPVELATWQSLAEARILEAQEAGEFDNLPGMGQPIPGIDGSDYELWWVKQKLRQENVSLLPPGLEIRLEVEKALATIWQLPSEAAVRQAVAQLNERIRSANLAAVWGPPSTTQPLDLEETLTEWASRPIDQE